MPKKATDIPCFEWPLRAFPKVLLVRRFFACDKGFTYNYLSPFHTLHLFDYQGCVRVGEHEFEFCPGDTLITPKGIKSTFDLPKSGHHLCIYFKSGQKINNAHIRLPLYMSLRPWFKFITNKILNIAGLLPVNEQNPVSTAAASAALQELLLWLAAQKRHAIASPQSQRANLAVDRAVEWLMNNIDRNITVPQLAKSVGLSQNYLAYHFRKRFGMTILHYLLTCRVEQARSLLETTDLPVKVIGNRVGLSDPQYFNKQFRRLVGKSPSSVRLYSLINP